MRRVFRVVGLAVALIATVAIAVAAPAGAAPVTGSKSIPGTLTCPTVGLDAATTRGSAAARALRIVGTDDVFVIKGSPDLNVFQGQGTAPQWITCTLNEPGPGGVGTLTVVGILVLAPVVVPQTFTLFGLTEPAIADDGDPGANVELGVKFNADTAGSVTGVRFFKSAANTGVHTGTLWTSSGTPLATVTFAGETASGWQQASFASPVAITAGTTYVVSYHTTAGHYAFTPFAFTSQFDNPPLHALGSVASGGNGVFRYGDSAFPTQSFQDGNYWVDVTFAA